jgi:uncharacterized protein (TIGR02466 family)
MIKNKKKSNKTVVNSDGNIVVNRDLYFSTPVYIADGVKFLKTVNMVSEDYLSKAREMQKINELYPVIMSNSYFADQRITDFTNFIGNTSWNILSDQGYDMNGSTVAFSSMWTQEHHKHSAMEQHTHGYGAQIVGFYFLEVPENSLQVMFYDPRPGKVQIDLPESNISQITLATKIINYTPKPGMIIFTNAWLSHSFSRHGSDKPLKFIHFNLDVVPAPKVSINRSTAEVV